MAEATPLNHLYWSAHLTGYTLKTKIISRPTRITHTRSGTTSYKVEVSITTHWRYWRGRIYHFYDMRFPGRVPGYGRLCEVLRKRFGAEIRMKGFQVEGEEPARWRDRFVGWSIAQDVRCHYLNYEDRKHLGWVDIDEETYQELLRQ